MAAKAAAIIVAAGRSTRMGGIDKVLADLLGKPVIAHTIEAFERAANISGIVLVVPKGRIAEFGALAERMHYTKIIAICEGGERRQDSTRNGLARTEGYDIVAVHDGARCCIRTDTIERCVEEAEKCGAVIAASPVTDTIKSISEGGAVTATIDRSRLRAVHTPQAFRRELLLSAYDLGDAEATDEAMLVERAGHTVMVYDDYSDNIKITKPEDLAIAKAILSSR